ncbi:MAG: SDR family oxidoreductase [Deltaproteobacteria bacterium]|nr:SDR family oxidoreductase [Deltaproteobacteria bacterium]
MGRLDGKVSIVTGSGTGIGRAIASVFAREGAKVVVAEMNEQSGKETVEIIKTEGGDAAFIKTDVSKGLDTERMVQFAVKTYGKLTVLCNNAAIYGFDTREITDFPEEDWDRMMNVNLKGVFLCCKYAIPAMKLAGGGSIVSISSIGALVKSVQPAYAASKGGVLVFTKGIAAQVAEFNIRANVICPSTIETPGRTASIKTGYYKHDFIDHAADAEKEPGHTIMARILPRFGTPEDIAYAALFLASDESAYITAAVFPVDGGTVRTRGD